MQELETRNAVWTDRREGWNSYVDKAYHQILCLGPQKAVKNLQYLIEVKEM